MSSATSDEASAPWRSAIARMSAQVRELRSGLGRAADLDLACFGNDLGPLPPELAEEARRCLRELLEVEEVLRAALDESRAHVLTGPRRSPLRHPAFVDVQV